MKRIMKRNWLRPLIGCLISLGVLLMAVPSVFGYELKLYHPIAMALLTALVAAASYAGLILRKKTLSGAGRLFSWLSPFLAALSMAGWPRMGGAVGTVCGVLCLLLSQWAFWRCVESKKLRRCAAFLVIGLITVGILIVWLMDVCRVNSDLLDEIVMIMFFVGFNLLAGALAALCAMAEKRWSRNIAWIFVPLAAFGLMMMAILTYIAFAPREFMILQEAISPSGRLIAEEYTADEAAEGSIRVRENSEGIDVLIGRLSRVPDSVYWHYASADVETLDWLDDDTLLINGDAWPWRQFAD